MYCIHCGTQLPDNAKFCHNCGNAISTGRTSPEPPAPQPAPPTPQPPIAKKQRPKWMVPLIVGASVMAALIVVIGIWTTPGKKAQQPAIDLAPHASAVVTESSEPVVEKAEFQHYENKEVKFAFDYPAGFSLSEPNVNNVLLGKGDECRVAVEYAYRTTKNCFIYSAEDFVRQIEADPTVLSGYLGAENVEAKSEGRVTTANGQERYDYSWTLSQNGKDYVGGLYIYDSQGDFGCYTFMWMVENGTDDTALFHEQINQKMLPSFKITGAYQAEGYTIYECEKPDYLRFAVRNEQIQDNMELGYDYLENYVRIYPAEKGRSQIGMYTPRAQYASADPGKDNLSNAMELAVRSVFSDKDYQDARFISQPTRLEIGRYPFIEVDLQCHYTGYNADEEQIRYVLLFPRNGKYWQVEMIATEETLEQTSQVLVDFLMSLQIEDDGLELGEDAFGSLPDFKLEDYQSAAPAAQGDMNQVIDEILTKVESTSGFVKPDDYYQPLASFTDVDGNGVSELLVVYKVKQRSSGGFDDYNALYDVYAVKSDGSYTAVTTGQTLYQEVGGNSGVLGLVVDKAKKPYLMVESSSPQGDRFNDTICYIPWGGDQSKLEDEWVYLESHGTYGEEDKGQYILGDTKVDKAAFDARQTEFMSLWTDLDLNRGPGNGGNNMSFSQIRSIDMNTYTFPSA